MNSELSKLKVLICGLGSIGERHFNIVKKITGSSPEIFRTTSRTPRTIQESNLVIHKNLEKALASGYDIVIISNPTSMHVDTSLKALEHGCHLLIEKPLCHELKNLDKLRTLAKEKNAIVTVGYMMRFHPHIFKIKEIIESRVLGEVLSYKSHWGEYLPEWHPWEDYKTSYAARKDLGGGASLTLSHDIDLAYYLLKNLTLVNKVKNPGHLDTEVDESAIFLFKTDTDADVSVKLDFLTRPTERKITIELELGTLIFDYCKNKLETHTAEGVKINTLESFERDQLFESQFRSFLDSIYTNTPPKVSLDESIRLLEVIL